MSGLDVAPDRVLVRSDANATFVMAGLDPAISICTVPRQIAGSSPAMTV